MEAVSTTINTVVHPVIITNVEADQGTEQIKGVILREKAWSLKHQRKGDKKDHLNVRYRELISTTAITELTIMMAAEGEGATDTGVISQDLPTLKMNEMRTKKTDSTLRARVGILKVNGEGKEGRKIKFTITTTRYK